LACLVTGFAGKISQYKKAINALLAQGYDVIAFEYDNAVLDAGDARLLPELIHDITDTLGPLSSKYDKIICTGVSLGAQIAINVQRRLQNVSLGVYGTAGAPVSLVIFRARVFYKIKKAFTANGFTEASLRKVWQQIDEDGHSGLGLGQSVLVVLGKQDRILPYKIAVKVLEGWKKQGTRVDYFPLRTLGHSMTIRWYKNHLDQLLARARA